jgi:F-type H+-transporting ATPase subunit delta
MSGSPHALARRYARALLEVADAQGGNAALALRDELREFEPLLQGSAELRGALLHPGVSAEQKRRLLAAIAERAGASPLLVRLLDLLGIRDRASLLPDVVRAYAELANARRGVVSAEVASAVPLPEHQRRALAAALGGGGAGVELQARVAPELLGGIVVRTGGRTYDGTVRTALTTLRRRLTISDPADSAGTR